MTIPLIMQPTTKGQAICPYCGVGSRLWIEADDGKPQVPPRRPTEAHLHSRLARGLALAPLLNDRGRLPPL